MNSTLQSNPAGSWRPSELLAAATAEEESELYAEQVKQLYGNARMGMLATGINSLVLILIQNDVTPPAALFSWLGLLAAISLWRYRDIRAFWRSSPEAAAAKHWGRRFIAGLAVSGTAWGSTAIFLFPVESVLHQTFLAFVIGGMVAGAAGAFSSVMKAFLAYSIPALGPIILRFALLGDQHHLAMGGMTLLFGVMTFFTALRIHNVRITSLKLWFENSGLVAFLTSERAKSDRLNSDLLSENAQRERIEKELRKSEGRLRYLSAELLNAQEKERKLIAQEIHDSIGGSLASAKVKVESTIRKLGQDSLPATAALESISRILQAAVEDARRIQATLRPSILDDFGILATLAWFSRQFESAYSDIRLRREIQIEEKEVPNSLKIVIFRVVQEAMNNIGKHSKANAAVLSLGKLGGSIYLEIRDNGQGFDLVEAHSRIGTDRGLGLESMRERVELSGGVFGIESGKGMGTTIKATWPVKNGTHQF